MRRILCVVCTAFAALLLAAADEGGASNAQDEATRFSQMYFAPMDGANFFRLYVPETGMVEFCRRYVSMVSKGLAYPMWPAVCICSV